MHFLQNDLHFWSHTRTHTHLWFATAHLEALKKERVPYTQHRRDGKALGKPGDEPLGANGHQLNVQPIQLLKGFVGRMAMARSWICCMVSSHECDMGTSFKNTSWSGLSVELLPGFFSPQVLPNTISGCLLPTQMANPSTKAHPPRIGVPSLPCFALANLGHFTFMKVPRTCMSVRSSSIRSV